MLAVGRYNTAMESPRADVENNSNDIHSEVESSNSSVLVDLIIDLA